jgi:hypothetical protein
MKGACESRMKTDTYVAFMFTYSPGHDSYKRTGEPKKDWFLRLPPGSEGPDWDAGGEEGSKYGCSVKSECPRQLHGV